MASVSVGITSAAEVNFAAVEHLGKLSGTLLQLEEVEVSALNALVSISILTFLVVVEVAEAVNFELIAGALFL